jgi:hypothetical protein
MVIILLSMLPILCWYCICVYTRRGHHTHYGIARHWPEHVKALILLLKYIFMPFGILS